MVSLEEKEIEKNLLRLSKALASYKQRVEMGVKATQEAQEAMKAAKAYQDEARFSLLQVNKFIIELKKTVNIECWELLKGEIYTILGVNLPIFDELEGDK